MENSCASRHDSIHPAGGGNNNGEFNEVLESGGDFEQPVPKNTVVEDRSEPEPGPDGNHGMEYIYGTTDSRVPFVKKWTSKFPSGIPATPTNADVCGFWGDTYISDTEGAIYFGTGSGTAGTESGQLKYDGRGFENSDYTLFVVYRPSSGSGIYHLAWGASDNPNEYLAIGFDGDTDEIFMSHGPNQTLRGSSGGPYNWYLYTFRFSQTEGMSIYENDRFNL